MFGLAAGLVFGAGASGGQGTVELRIVTAETFDAGGHGNGDSIEGAFAVVDLDASSFARSFYVQARVMGDPAAIGLVAVEARLSDGGSTSFTPSTLVATEAFGVPTPGIDPAGREGLLPPFRDNAPSNSAPQNGQMIASSNEWAFFPLDTDPTGNGAGIAGEWATIYKFDWSTTDLSERNVLLTIDAPVALYLQEDGSQAVAETVPGQFELVFDDCDDIDRNGDDMVTVLDLLDYLSAWFERATF